MCIAYSNIHGASAHHPHTSGGQCPRSCWHNMSGAVAGGGIWRREDAAHWISVFV